jgi:hypothetical protein
VDTDEAVGYIFDGLVEDGYVPHRDEIEALLFHTFDYLRRVGYLDNDYGNGAGI